MTNKEILQADMLDILFEHRNKTYGAYALRKDYNNRLGIALAIALSVVLLSVLFSFIKKNDQQVSATNEPFDIIVLKTYEPPADIQQQKEKPKEKIKQVKNLDKILIVPNNILPDVPEQKDLIDAIVGKENIEGKPLENPDKSLQTGTDNKNEKRNVGKDLNMTITPKEIPPSYPGGISEWLNFLRRNLQTPGELNEGQKITVRVRFWIDTDGSVSRFEIVQSGGGSFDKEVLRVMKKMPRWEPAVQNNLKVAVAYIQSVIFVGVEE